jgi:hypothetical protein
MVNAYRQERDGDEPAPAPTKPTRLPPLEGPTPIEGFPLGPSRPRQDGEAIIGSVKRRANGPAILDTSGSSELRKQGSEVVGEMVPHPIADLFPTMSDGDLTELAEDIKRNGLLDPIITFEDKILDGRHRFKACRVAGVDPVFQPFEGEDPVAYVVSKNLHRRHLTASQRAVIANEMARLPLGANQHSSIDEPSIGQAQAAELLRIGKATVERARRVEREAPELVEPIRRGEMTINAAVKKIKEKTPKNHARTT